MLRETNEGYVNDSTPRSGDAAEQIHTSTVQLEDAGYHKRLTSRQVQMIAIGGAIGTGLFLGAGGRLAQAGPSIVISYAVCGLFAFFILRALGELVLPSLLLREMQELGLVRLIRARVLR